MVMQLSVRRTITRLTAPGWRMNHLLWRTTVLLSLSLNSVLSGKDYEGYRVLREGFGSFSSSNI